MASDTHRAIDAVWRIESAKIIGGLARILRDVGLAKELGRELEAQGELAAPDVAEALDDALAQVAPSPVVELNRAVALAMAFGPAAGLELVDALTSEPSLKHYHLLPSVHGDFLARLGRFDEACAEFKRAASLTRKARERELLLDRAAAVTRYGFKSSSA
jgi:predicted RNA polymerase sigma factor